MNKLIFKIKEIWRLRKERKESRKKVKESSIIVDYSFLFNIIVAIVLFIYFSAILFLLYPYLR